jgi:hypothetical protein
MQSVLYLYDHTLYDHTLNALELQGIFLIPASELRAGPPTFLAG